MSGDRIFQSSLSTLPSSVLGKRKREAKTADEIEKETKEKALLERKWNDPNEIRYDFVILEKKLWKITEPLAVYRSEEYWSVVYDDKKEEAKEAMRCSLIFYRHLVDKHRRYCERELFNTDEALAVMVDCEELINGSPSGKTCAKDLLEYSRHFDAFVQIVINYETLKNRIPWYCVTKCLSSFFT